MKKFLKWAIGIALVLAVLGGVIAWYAYNHTVQGAIRGGTVRISEPTGAIHINTQWHRDSVWYEYYMPSNNTCVTQEMSGFGLLQGTIIVDNCNYQGRK